MSERMELEEFRRMLDVHGARVQCWPAPVREAAQVLLAEDAQARALLAQARALEELLRADAPPPPAADLQQRILARVEAEERRTSAAAAAAAAANDNGVPWWTVAPLAASLLLGVWLGLSGVLAPLGDTLLGTGDGDLAAIAEVAMPLDDEGELL